MDPEEPSRVCISMALLIFILVVLVVLALALYAVRLITGIDVRIAGLIQVILVVLAIVVIIQRAGLL
tara:strand:+ start:355 stop:555 length:201 start_codon:yes stop_codon:yes gene_type:complete